MAYIFSKSKMLNRLEREGRLEEIDEQSKQIMDDIDGLPVEKNRFKALEIKGVSFIWYPFLMYEYGFGNILFGGEKGSGKGHLLNRNVIFDWTDMCYNKNIGVEKRRMEDIERTYELDEYLKLLSNASIWEASNSVERFCFFEGSNWIQAKVSSEVIDFLQPYKDDIVNMAVADEVVVCHGYNFEDRLTTEEEFKGCTLPQSLWDLKEKYNCCIEFIHCFVYFACEDVPEIRGIHMKCEDDTAEDPYFIWTASKDIAVREIYMSNVSIILDNFWDFNLDEKLCTLDYMEIYVYNAFNDELSKKWVKYTFNTDLLRNYIFAAPFFHLYDNKDFDKRIESITNSIKKTRLIGRKEGEAITYYYDVIDMVVNDTKEYLLEGKEIELTRVERHEYIGDWEFEGNHWLRFLVEHCDLQEAKVLYRAFLDYVVLDKRFGVREEVEKDRHGNDIKRIIYYKVDKEK